MIDYLPLVLTGIGIIVAIVYYTLTLRNANKTQELQLETRQAQLFMQIFNRQYDIDQRKSIYLAQNIEYKDFDDFIEKYGPETNPARARAIIRHILRGYWSLGEKKSG
jgi:hypothetical protein